MPNNFIRAAVHPADYAVRCRIRPFAAIRWQVRLNQSYYKPHEIKGLEVITRPFSLTWKAKQSILSLRLNQSHILRGQEPE